MTKITRTTPTALKIALWAVNLQNKVADRAAWLALLEAQMLEAKRQGADLLVMPEYVSAQWLHWADAPMPGKSMAGAPLMNWMAAEGRALLPEMELLVTRHGIGLVAGSMPVLAAAEREDLGTLNRAWILLPQEDGTLRRLHHDKLVPTPPERETGDWPIRLGGRVAPFEYRGAKIAVLICLDVEMPAVAAKLQSEALDLLIVPSMTSQISGYHRVFDCAKARAIELMSAVAAVGCIGEAPQNQGGNCSAASLFVPCEMHLGGTGRAAELAPRDKDEGPGPMLVAEVPVAAIRRARRHAEAWPGPFDAAEVTVGDGDVVAHIPRFSAAK
jgi:predicted amidohydrolase